jgi:hypothetical protein
MESMETKNCHAYNATRGCIVSSKVIISECANQPLTILRLLVESLGFKAEAALWLTPLTHAPQLMRPFPFDLVYLDKDLKVIQAAELFPEVPFPRYDERVATVLMLPLHALSTTGTQIDDQLIICAKEDLEVRIAGIASPTGADIAALTVLDPVTPASGGPVEAAPAATSLSVATVPKPAPLPFPASPAPIVAAAVTQSTGFTVALTTTWQITNSTMAPALPGNVKAAQEAASNHQLVVLPVADEELETNAESVDAPEQPQLQDCDATVAEPSSPVAVGVQEESQPAADVSEAAEPEAIAAVEAGGSVHPDADVPVEFAATQETAGVELPTPETQTTAPVVARVETPKKAAEAINVPTEIEPEIANKGSKSKKKDPLGALKRFLNAEDPLPERRAVIRLLSPGLVAYDTNGGKPCEVSDVSPTGLFVRTRERWRPGDLISLTIQKKNATEKEYQSRVVVQAGTVRCGADGVGLTFALPEGVEFRPWHRVHTKRSDETDGEYFVRELRIARALGFLRRICPPAGDEIRQLLYVRHSNKRVASAAAIALKAEELLMQNGNADSVVAHPDLVVRILEDGSWAEDEWIQQRWAGLLATSCTKDGQDKSNLVFVEMLDKLTPIHLRILYAACRKGAEVMSTDEQTSKITLYCTADELIEAAGTHSLPRIQQTIGHLANFGLLAENNRPSYLHATEKTKSKTTPTSLGFQMFARCSGRR